MKAHATDLHCQSEENAKTNKEEKNKENTTKPLCAKLLLVTTDIPDIFLICYY